MLLNLWQFLVTLATADYMWIWSGISVIFIFFMIRQELNNKLKENKGFYIFIIFLFEIMNTLALCIYHFDQNHHYTIPHFLLWHLVALGVFALGAAGWFVFKGLKKLWGLGKNWSSKLLNNWRAKQNELKEIRGAHINEELATRRENLEKLMDDGAISESIRAQVNNLFTGPFRRLLSVRQFLLENNHIFNKAEANVLSNNAVSPEIKKEATKKREQLSQKLKDVNASLQQIIAAVDMLIIRLAEIRAGLGQGSTEVEANLNELNEMVSAIEGGISEIQAVDDRGVSALPAQNSTEEMIPNHSRREKITT